MTIQYLESAEEVDLFANFTILIHLYITKIIPSHMLTFQSFTILFKDIANLFYCLFLVIRK